MHGGAFQRKLVYLGLGSAEYVNTFFNRISLCMQFLVLPQAKAYQRRVYLTYVYQLLCSEMTLLVCAKLMATFYYNNNALLLLTIGSFLPFMGVVYRVWRYLPCDRITEYISNAALLVCGIFLYVVLQTDGSEAEEEKQAEVNKDWSTDLTSLFVRLMMFWPFIVLASMVSRLHVERIGSRNPFSPLTDLPLLGIISSTAYIFMLEASKSIPLTDCVALCFLDPIVCAVVSSLALGRYRIHFNSKYLKVYTCLTFAVLIYLYCPDWNLMSFPSFSYKTERMGSHALFVFGRTCLAIRSFYGKKAYCKFHRSAPPPRPPENELLFENEYPPHKHRFAKFPEPTLITLDAIFDSGLRDMDFHGMGPLGTLDLHNLTEMAYLLPLAAVATNLLEPTYTKGLYDPLNTYAIVGPTTETAKQIAWQASITDQAFKTRDVIEQSSQNDYVISSIVIVVFCISRLFSPTAASNVLFDKGSSMHSWKYQPVLLLMVFFFIDILWINTELTVDRIVWIVVGAVIYAYWRDQVYSYFRRKQYLHATQELQYYQPQTLRTLQRRTLLEFMDKASTEDYGLMLLSTSIRNGLNVRELSRDTDLKVWDPAPASTAAWKLAVSMFQVNFLRRV
jgi:hypothetical protein